MASQIQSQGLEKYVRNKIDHSYNNDVFEKQLNDEINKNLVKMQTSIIKDIKRKLLIEEHEKKQLERREKLKSDLSNKLQNSQSKRQKDKEEKMKTMKRQRESREKLHLQRKADLKKKQIQIAQSRIKQFEESQRRSPIVSYNKIQHAVSLLEEPHYKKKLYTSEQEYAKLKRIVEEKKAFEMPKMHRKQLSFSQIKPRTIDTHRWEQQRLNKMGEHLDRIEEGRKKKEKLLEDRVKKSKSIQDYARKTHRQKMMELKEKQKKKKDQLMEKLGKQRTKTYNEVKKRELTADISNSRSEQNPENSILYEQGHDREKFSYRKEIKQQIRQYMLKEKQKLLLSN